MDIDVANRTTTTRISPTKIAYKYCLRKPRENSIWYESEKHSKIEFIPFPTNTIEKKSVPDNNPLRLLLFISKKISWKKPEESLGMKDSIKFKKVLSKFSIGKYGIKFSTNNKKGKKAIKKLKEILPALVDICLLYTSDAADD